VRRNPVAQATSRLSRDAAKPECGRGGRRKRRPRRTGENPGEAESQESIDPSAGRQPRGERTHRADQDPVAAEDRVLPETSEWRNAVSVNGRRVRTPRGARLPGRSKALKGEPHERHRPEKGRKPAGGVNRRGRVKRRGRNEPGCGSPGKRGLRQVATVAGERNPKKDAFAPYRRGGRGRQVIPWRDLQACGSSRGRGPGRCCASKTSKPEERQGGIREPERG